jgi:hypothetical protein
MIKDRAVTDLSRRYAVSQDSLLRHRRDHIPTDAQIAAIQARDEEEAGHGLDLLDSANETRLRMGKILDTAEAGGDLRAAVAAGREMLNALSVMAKLRGEISDAPILHVMLSGPIIQLQQLVIAALQDHPAARQAVSLALAQITEPAPIMIEGNVS